MEKTEEDFILGALDNLPAVQLDIFKHKLSARHGIGYGLIEKESNVALTGRIISKFTRKHAIARTAKVLRAMDLHDQADGLEEANARQGASSAAGTGDTRGRASDSSFTPTEVKEVNFQEPRTREQFLQYSCRLTLDPNTAHDYLRLSEGNREVTRVDQNQSYPDHPERFDCLPQVLCREGLSGRCYWEAEWSGWEGGGKPRSLLSSSWVKSNLFSMGVYISVSYKEISRKGRGDDCRLGYNDKSWSLDCFSSRCRFWHNNKYTELPAPPSSRIGVYLDHRAGTLSFYSVSDTMTLLHRVQTTFTQPLHPGFGVYYGSGCSVKLCDL